MEQGFSAIELLITLFVAAAFLVTGYQLYYTVLDSSGQARLRTIANNIAYDKLRFYAAQATDPCTAKTDATLNPSLPANHGLGNADVTATITCPFSGSRVSRVQIQINYGTQSSSGQEITRHVIYTSPNL